MPTADWRQRPMMQSHKDLLVSGHATRCERHTSSAGRLDFRIERLSRIRRQLPLATVGVEDPACRGLGYGGPDLRLGEPASPVTTMRSLLAQLRGNRGYRKTTAIRSRRTKRSTIRPARRALLRVVSCIFCSCTLFGDLADNFRSSCRDPEFLQKPTKNKVARNDQAVSRFLARAPTLSSQRATVDRVFALILVSTYLFGEFAGDFRSDHPGNKSKPVGADLMRTETCYQQPLTYLESVCRLATVY
jgi:hypothetical protein